MPTFSEGVLKTIHELPGSTDRQLTNALFDPSKPQQQVNQEARLFAQRKLTVRMRGGDGRLRNYPQRRRTMQVGINANEENVRKPPSSSVFLVSCASRKADRPMRARELYRSALFTKTRGYVEVTGCPWFILSAEHGLVHPDSIIAPYDTTLNMMGVAARRAWANRVIEQMRMHLPAAERIVVFAGLRYREFLMVYLDQRVQVVETPLEGKRIGEQLHWLSRQDNV
jgi:hypothetical protein